MLLVVIRGVICECEDDQIFSIKDTYWTIQNDRITCVLCMCSLPISEE